MVNKLAAATVALVAFALLAYGVSQAAPWQEDPAGGAEDVDALVQDLFTDHVVALEVLGILLTAAMIGALVIARPLTGGADSSHYPKVTEAEMESAQRASDLRATFGPPARVSTLLGTPEAEAAATAATATAAQEEEE